jgi:diguanylate cyclase (GGDEF)-like protein/PAS domain S-box-containing protein
VDFRTIVELSPDPIARFDRAYRHTFVSPATLRMAGLSATAMLGRTPAEIGLPTETADTLVARLEATFTTGSGSTFELVHAGRTLEVTTVLVPGDDDAGAQVMTVSRDVTDRYRAERLQGALHRLAATVARGDDPTVTFAVAAAEAARVIEADGGGIVRFLGDDHGETVAAHIPSREDATALLRVFPFPRGGVVEAVARTGRPARVDTYDDAPDSNLPAFGQMTAVGTPITVDGALWGLLVVTRERPGSFPPDTEAILASAGEIVGLAIANADARERMRLLALTDPLCGIANRRAFEHHLAGLVAEAHDAGSPLALAVLDLDGFKAVNDANGHVIGDAVLVETTRRLTSAARSTDVLARQGGDEFALVLPATAEADLPGVLARALDLVQAEPYPVAGRLSISIGAAVLRPGESADDLYRRADDAQTAAKRDHRGTVIAPA